MKELKSELEASEKQCMAEWPDRIKTRKKDSDLKAAKKGEIVIIFSDCEFKAA